jgi:hypothetical protein
MAGRPSTYTEETAALICARIAEGETLTAICAADGMPDRVTVWRWTEANESFRNAYARAKEARVERMADEILHIADDATADIRTTDDGAEVVDHEHIQRSKLRVDTRKWLLAKLAPKKYGERVDLNHAGGVSVTIAQSDADL